MVGLLFNLYSVAMSVKSSVLNWCTSNVLLVYNVIVRSGCRLTLKRLGWLERKGGEAEEKIDKIDIWRDSITCVS